MAARPKKAAAGRKPAGTARLSKAPRKVAAPARSKPHVRVFVSYSHVDETARAKLETHLAALKQDNVSTWFDGDLNAGDALDTNIGRELRNADIFVALLSPDYLASNYCWNIEYKRAMSRRLRGHLHVVAAVVRPCDWKATRAARFKLLPKDGKPVTQWRPADRAYLNIAEGIRGVVAAVRNEMAGKPAKATTGSAALKAKLPAKKSTTKPKSARKIAAPKSRAKTATTPARKRGRPPSKPRWI